MKSKKTFVFNDEDKANSYGFSIVTDGIDLTRFQKNPIMLSGHNNENDHVIGRWDNVRVDGIQLLGDAVFDDGDEKAKSIGGKVERGFIKSCSMGIVIAPGDLVEVDGALVLQKCELMEVSIVPVPSNQNAVTLYNTKGTRLSMSEVKTLCLSATIEGQPGHVNEDGNIVLNETVFKALGFKGDATEGVTVEELEGKVMELHAKVQKVEKEKENDQKKKLSLSVDKAIRIGKVPATQREHLLSYGLTNPKGLEQMLDSIPAKQSLMAQLSTSSPEGNKSTITIKTLNDYRKHAPKLLSDDPELFKKLVAGQTIERTIEIS